MINSLQGTDSQMDNVLASGFVDNEIVVLKKINPYRAAQIVEQLGIIKRTIGMMERELQQAAAQATLLN